MDPFPHHYEAHASAESDGDVLLDANGAATLEVGAPVQFGGPGGQWSPETLLVAAAASCFVLTFRSVAANSKLAWSRLECDAHGVLERRDGVTRFTGLHVRARLELPGGSDPERAKRLLDKAEKGCLVTSSLALAATLESEVVVAG
ncbi:MAG: OsmC family protein [Thermodesulfobacteriota bacterium]